jgi:nicotinate-nucleotide pyrophosphorylase (carboxylating)
MIKDRTQLVQSLFNQKEKLTLENKEYKLWVFRYTFLEFEKDLGEYGDITTDGLIKDGKNITARIYANENGIMAGGEEIHFFLMASDPTFKPRLSTITITQRLEDGKYFTKDDMLIELNGDAKHILKAERVILNLLQHMTGIATQTQKIVEKTKRINPHILVVPTRKTTWGLLDKKAVTLGGGGTHRLNLSDAVLIKDNHLTLFEGDVNKLLRSFHPPVSPYKFFEIEFEDFEKIPEYAKLIHELQKNNALPKPVIIMFDNVSPENINKTLNIIQQEPYYDELLFEASGGINEENISEYAKTGVDLISLGSLTQKITPIDLSLEIGAH